jgi:hypothetical protein
LKGGGSCALKGLHLCALIALIGLGIGSAYSAEDALSDVFVAKEMPDVLVVRVEVETFENDGLQAGSTQYQAQGVGGLAVQILAHAMSVSAQLEAKRRDAEESGRKMGDEYKSKLLGGVSTRALLRRAIPGLQDDATAPGKSAAKRIVIRDLSINVGADHRSLSVGMDYAATGEGIDERGTFTWISHPFQSEKSVDDWAQKGPAFSLLVDSLLLKSLSELRSAIRENAGSSASRQKTVKYLKGGSVQYKRAVILTNRCDTVLVRDLSNKLFMLPVAERNGAETGC